MSQLETTTVFAGVDGRADAQLPDWYARQTAVDSTESVSFAEAIRSLPRAIETPVAYYNPSQGEWVETSRFNALVEPSRLASMDSKRPHVEPDGGVESADQSDSSRTDEADALFHIPTRSYSVINPVDAFGPLENVLRETSIDDQSLGDVIFDEDDEVLTEEGAVRTVYDPACGTGGMLSVAEDHVRKFNEESNLKVFGQELNPESWALKSDISYIRDCSKDIIEYGNYLRV